MTDPTTPERILLAEDDAALRQTLAELLKAYGYAVVAAADGRLALRLLQREEIDLVITDLQMPVMGGELLLEQVRATFPAIPVITITGFGSLETAVALTRAGAADYLTKPLQTQVLLASIRRALEESRPRRELAQSRRQARGYLQGLIGRIASSPAAVLITGETGTGKELVARAVHRASGRNPFVPVNCGAIPANLLESELFGHVRGAFTGADHDRAGLFEEAHGGTLFLDEIAELPLALQAKLLRALQFGELRRVGSTEVRHVQVRLIAATHQDLRVAAQEGRFRQDLYYRINVLRLEVPPLREHAADLPLLAEHFLAQLAQREALPPLHIAPHALAALIAYPWPGNVRELQNVLERAAILAPGPDIDLADLPSEIRAAAPAGSPELVGRELTLAEVEREHILGVLARLGGNRLRTAEVLGIPRRTLYRRLEEYGLLGDEE